MSELDDNLVTRVAKLANIVGATLEKEEVEVSKTEETPKAFYEGGLNKIFYGAPGTGKSYEVSQRYSNFKRITFHPDYTYFDFIGGLKPAQVEGNNGEKTFNYIFSPGPFARILAEAYNKPSQHIGLIIEEINRANTAAVFGDVFQLLDRDDTGKSKYPITNEELKSFLNEEVGGYTHEEIVIPSNLSLIATMNSSDQGVYVMDAAFKRRWEFEYLPINYTHSDFDELKVAGFDMKWKDFAITINNYLADIIDEEDKLIGQRFLSGQEIRNKDKVASKLLIYLWDDVVRYNRDYLFRESKQFSKLVEMFNRGGVEIFVPKLAEQLKNLKEENAISNKVLDAEEINPINEPELIEEVSQND